MFHKIIAFLLNILFPPVCVSCQKEGDFFCVNCLKNLDKKKIKPSYHKKINDSDIHYLDGVIYALDYAKNPQIQAAVKQLKYKFTQDLAEHFSYLIVEKIRELNMVKNRQIILIPVPLHKKRLNYRGFNQAEIIAKAAASHFSNDRVQVLELIQRIRHTDQQAKLDKHERRRNLEGAFELNKKFVQYDLLFTCARGPYFFNRGVKKKGEKEKYIKRKRERKNQSPIIFLVDDVFTTGSTLEECAKVLKKNGVQKVYGLVIARAFK